MFRTQRASNSFSFVDAPGLSPGQQPDPLRRRLCGVLAAICVWSVALGAVSTRVQAADDGAPGVAGFLTDAGALDLEALRAGGYEGPLDLGGRAAFVEPLTGALRVGDPEPSAASAPGDEHWSGEFRPAGISGSVQALAVYKGDLIAAGGFNQAGGVSANYIARWDGVSWSPLGTGLNSWASSLAVFGTDLIVGGSFNYAGGIYADHIARWDGVSWSPLGTGLNSTASSLATFGTDLIVTGYFTQAGGVSAHYVARWDGVSWSPLGTGLNSYAYSLAVFGTDLIVGGSFNQAGGVSANCIARWDGVSWSPLGTGLNSYAYSLAVFGTDLIVGGSFNQAGGVSANCIARWDGVSWSPLGTGLNSYAYSLAVFGTDLIVGGSFNQAGGVSANCIARWDGVSWSPLGTGLNNAAQSLAVFGTDLIVGGPFSLAGDVGAARIAAWSGTSWGPVGLPLGMNNAVQAVLPVPSGILAAGDFDGAGSAALARRGALFDGVVWSPLATGMDQSVRCLSSYGADVVAGGYFTQAGGAGANRVALWNGTAWNPLGGGINDRVLALAELGTDLYAGGGFTQAGGASANNIARWNGAGWAPLASGTNGTVYALAEHEGTLVAGGAFTTAGGVTCERLARWDGANWSALPGMNGVVLVLGHYGGQLVAGGTFTTAGGVAAGNLAVYDGTVWHPLGSGTNGQVLALAEVGGKLYVGGDFTSAGGLTVGRIAVWDGLAWSALGSGMNAAVRTLAFKESYLYAGGDFTTAGGKPSSFIARWGGLLGSCSVAVTQPMASDAICGGLSTEIRWTFSGNCGSLVDIDLLQDGVFCRQIAAGTANDGALTWMAEGWSALTDGYAIRVTEPESGATSVGGTFQILPNGTLAVTAPNGGEHLVTGLATELTWSHTACVGAFVRLELVAEGATCSVLASSAPNNGTFLWTPETCGALATGYRLRVVDLDSGTTDESDGDFVIGPAYRVLAVKDVGNDQGGQLRVQWHREDNDQAGATTPITQYSVWRRVETNLKGIAASSVPPEFVAMAYPPGIWDYVKSVPAGGEESYGTVCPSLCDSTDVDGIRWSVYFVRAHTVQPVVFFDTLPDSGYSVDNIAPAVPSGLARENGDLLTWRKATDADFHYFSVYGSAVDHRDGSEVLINHTTSSSLDIAGEPYAHFLVTATDAHGNESGAAVLDALSGVFDAQPARYALYPCAPNPFNPMTTIRFDLPQASQVTVRVFDLAGRLVQTLVNHEVMAAGRREVVWRGRDESGREAAAGAYFYRLDADSFSETKRMTLVK